MRKQILFLSLAGLFLSANAGEGAKHGKPLKAITTPVKVLNYKAPNNNLSNTGVSRASRALVKFPIGSAGNLNSVINTPCNQLYADDSINSVIFIHRSEDSVNSNRSQYRFAVSKNGGNTFTQSIGPLNPSADTSNFGFNGRFPQGVIYRPVGVTVADSAYLGYSGTWHNGSAGKWSGEYRGASQLTGNPATFREHNDTVNNTDVLIGGSFTVANDKFFNMNEENPGVSGSYANTPSTALIFEKGVWNDTKKNVDWVDTKVPFTFEAFAEGNSVLTNDVIAFDPSGQYGWMIGTGDITPNDGKYKIAPFYMKSTDYGATWSTAKEINTDTITGFQVPLLVDPNTGDTIKTTLRVVGNIDLVVDYLGNPHMLGIFHLAALDNAAYDTYYPFYGYRLFDLTIGSNLCQSGWVANFLKNIYATAGQFNITDPQTNTLYTDNNRLQASRTLDGKRVFALWAETDSAYAAQQIAGGGQYDNISPDLLGIGIDVVASKTTAVKNFTTGDPQFSGLKTGVAEGTFGGALYSHVSQTTFTKGTTYNVPAILSEADYKNPTASPKKADQPARFYYCQNINFDAADFTFSSDKEPPVITVNVNDTVVLHKDSTFNIPPATAFDCKDGVVPVVTSSNVVNTATGSYTLTYYATDAAGNKDSIRVVVLVQDKPIALYSSLRLTGNKYTFKDTSLNFPTTRRWTFSDNSAASTQQTFTRTFTKNGALNVCLKVSNTFGTDSICKSYTIALGIENVEMANAISVFPTTSNGLFTINVAKSTTDDLTVVAYDLNGAKVSEEKSIKSNTATSIDFTTLSSGLYQLKIGNEKDGFTVKPVVINK